MVEEFLHLEGFDDVQYVLYGEFISDTEPLASDKADLGPGFGSDFIIHIDSGAPITVLGGLHVGCMEMFANDRVAGIRDLAGKRIVSHGAGGPVHIFISTIVAHVGVDPARDVEWVEEPDSTRWPTMLKEGKIDVVSVFPPATYSIRDAGVGRVILNTTIDDPWKHYFCCMLAARNEFVQRYPVATKRAMRAFVKASQFCELEQDSAARLLVERGATGSIGYARTALAEIPFDAWRSYDPEDTVRFFALRLGDAGLVKRTPSEILSRSTDFRFINEIRRELKV